MQPRTYVLLLIATALTLISAIVGTNLIIDPQGVFGTGVLPLSPNANQRYLSYVDYKTNSGRYDALLFGSSRAQAFDPGELSRRLGAKIADFSVAKGTIADHLAVLNFVLRDKAAKGQRLRAVFLLVDADILGESSSTNVAIQFLQPPAITGSHTAYFWWRNLVSVQYQAWRDTVRAARRRQAPKETATANPAELPLDTAAPVAHPAGGVLQPILAVGAADLAVRSNWITARPDYRRDIEDLGRFAALCGERGIRLVMATAPVSSPLMARYDAADLDRVVSEISHIAPVWDFTTTGQLADSADLWLDDIHFSPKVADMMLRRIFGDAMPSGWTDFGRLRPP